MLQRPRSLSCLGVFLFVFVLGAAAQVAHESLSAKAARLAAGQLQMEAGTILRPSSPTDNFIFATYLDRLGELACSSVRSAIANGVELAILALNDGGAGFLHERDPKRRKVSALRAFLQHFSNDTLIVFSDGTDVLYTPTARGTWARLFRDFDLNKPNSVVFGAERNCWPMMDGDRELQPGGRERCGLLEPARGAYSSFRYINAGNWIARRDVADRLLVDWQVVMEKPEHAEQDDQFALQQLVFGRDALSYSIEVDDACLMFQTGWGTKLERGGWRDKPGGGAREGPYIRARQQGGGCEIYNTETDTIPPLAHFNGDKREFVGAETFCFEQTAGAERAAFEQRVPWFAGLYPKLKESCGFARDTAASAAR